RRRPRRILDLGTGSGILAMAAAKRLRRKVLAADIEPLSVRVARENARLNQAHHMIRAILADGWRTAEVRRSGPYDLVFGNIPARALGGPGAGAGPASGAGGGAAFPAGLLRTQARDVAGAHPRHGLVLERMIALHPWTTLVARKRGFSSPPHSARKPPAQGAH